jgi:hypothetical protein
LAPIGKERMHADKNPSDGVQLNLRIGLRRQLADAARLVRSLNGEIVWRLWSSFGNEGWRDRPASDEREVRS